MNNINNDANKDDTPIQKMEGDDYNSPATVNTKSSKSIIGKIII